jgi:hypothetical protein
LKAAEAAKAAEVVKMLTLPAKDAQQVGIQWTFREHSGNIQGTFREHSVNIQWTFSEH